MYAREAVWTPQEREHGEEERRCPAAEVKVRKLLRGFDRKKSIDKQK